MTLLPVNVNHWRNFLRIADTGSFSRVAEVHGIGQPAISRQIRALEELYGVTLFDRTAQGTVLTEAGKLFYQRAAQIMAEMERLREDIATISDQPAGTLTVGLPVSLVPLLAAPVVAFAKERLPRVELKLVVGTVGLITESLLSGTCDLGLLFHPIEDKRLLSENLVRDPLVLLGSARSLLKTDRPMKPAEIHDLPMIFLGDRNGIRQRLAGAFAESGYEPNIILEADSMSVLHLLDADIGYSPFPSAILADRQISGRVRHCEIEGLHITWCMSRVRSETPSRAARIMQEMIRAEMRTSIASGRWKAEWLPPDPAAPIV